MYFKDFLPIKISLLRDKRMPFLREMGIKV